MARRGSPSSTQRKHSLNERARLLLKSVVMRALFIVSLLCMHCAQPVPDELQFTTTSAIDAGEELDAGTGGEGGGESGGVSTSFGVGCDDGSVCTENGEPLSCGVLGYCTKSCQAQSDCPVGSLCNGFFCLLTCETPGEVCGGHGVCDSFGQSTRVICTANCNLRGGDDFCTDNGLGNDSLACAPDGRCCGALGYACCGGEECYDGSFCGAEGYCHY